MPPRGRQHPPDGELAKLLLEVRARPDDLALKQVYADAALSAGDPHGELLAVQAQLEQLGCGRADTLFLEWVQDALADDGALDDGRIAALRKRETTLLNAHGERWKKEKRPDGYRPSATHYELEGKLAQLAAGPDRGLQRLTVSHSGGPHEVQALATAPWFARLRGLVLNGHTLTPVDIERALHTPTQLEELQLVDTRLAVQGVEALARIPWLGRLRVLGVRHGRLGPGEAKALLAHAALRSGLLALDLRTNKLGSDDTQRLGAAFPALRVLDLGNNPLDLAAMERLIDGGGLGALRTLGLQKSAVTDAMLARLAASPLLARVRTLDLRKNALTDAGARHLGKSKHTAGLRTLHLGGNTLSAAARKALTTALPGARLYL